MCTSDFGRTRASRRPGSSCRAETAGVTNLCQFKHADSRSKKLRRARAIAQYFDGVNGSSREKATNLQAIMQAESVSPRKTVVVGDGEDDLAAVRKCRTWFVGVVVEQRIRGKTPHRVRHLTLLLPLLEAYCASPRSTAWSKAKRHKR